MSLRVNLIYTQCSHMYIYQKVFLLQLMPLDKSESTKASLWVYDFSIHKTTYFAVLMHQKNKSLVRVGRLMRLMVKLDQSL